MFTQKSIKTLTDHDHTLQSALLKTINEQNEQDEPIGKKNSRPQNVNMDTLKMHL